MSYTVKKHDLGYYFISLVPSEQELKIIKKKYYQNLPVSSCQERIDYTLNLWKSDKTKYLETFTGFAKAKISRSCIAYVRKQKK